MIRASRNYLKNTIRDLDNDTVDAARQRKKIPFSSCHRYTPAAENTLNWSGSLACILGGISLASGEAKTGIGMVAPALAVVTFSLAAAWIPSKGSSGAKIGSGTG